MCKNLHLCSKTDGIVFQSAPVCWLTLFALTQSCRKYMFQYISIVILHLFLFIVISLKLQPPVTLQNLRIVIVHEIGELKACERGSVNLSLFGQRCEKKASLFPQSLVPFGAEVCNRALRTPLLPSHFCKDTEIFMSGFHSAIRLQSDCRV